jgi:hypothetical protein
MRDFLMAALMLGVILFPFIAMPLLWRRMKRVRDQSYRERETPAREQPWQERIEDESGLTLARDHAPNDDLIGLGDRARHSRWPIDNQ